MAVQLSKEFNHYLAHQDEMVRLYREMQGNSSDRPITVVSHMMDLGPVYNQPGDGSALLRFQSTSPV